MAEGSKVEVIKEVFRRDEGYARVIIRSNCYGSNLAFLDLLFEAAQADFPTLTREEPEVVFYAGSFYARTFGIEFKAPSAVPEHYRDVKNTEKTF